MNAAVVTLGCRLNQADSALLTARLERMGFEAGPYDPAKNYNLIVLNSCAVTAAAERKTRQTLRSLEQNHPEARLVLTGCAHGAFAGEELPGVVVIPNERKSEFESILRNLPRPERAFETVFRENVLTAATGKTRANLKIQEGCGNFCAYCIVPYRRGPERSRDAEEVLEDFRHLLSLGFQEIVLTGINTCAYDCRGLKLPGLLRELLAVPGKYRIRIGSTEPGPVLPGIVDVMAEAEGRLCEFLHPSLQNGSDSVLRRMKRHCLTAEYAEYVSYAREKVPGIHIGTDVITGFPGETEEEFEESRAFLERMRFANLHIFPYSRRKGTAAYDMRPMVPNHLSRMRAEALHELREKLAAEYRRSLLGTVQTFLAEREDGTGLTGTFVTAKAPGGAGLRKIRIGGAEGETLLGTDPV